MDRISNRINDAANDGTDPESTAVGKDLAALSGARSEDSKALHSDRSTSADSDRTGSGEKGCLMCGACGSVGHCVLD